MFAAIPYSQIGLPFKYLEPGDYYERIQAQIKDLEEKLEDLMDQNTDLRKKLDRLKEVIISLFLERLEESCPKEEKKKTQKKFGQYRETFQM